VHATTNSSAIVFDHTPPLHYVLVQSSNDCKRAANVKYDDNLNARTTNTTLLPAPALHPTIPTPSLTHAHTHLQPPLHSSDNRWESDTCSGTQGGCRSTTHGQAPRGITRVDRLYARCGELGGCRWWGDGRVECALGADARSHTHHKLLRYFTPHTRARVRKSTGSAPVIILVM
jgi:hypothetical protein